MDTGRLVVGGHSFGGLTALSVADRDPRVKAVFTFDPWVWAKNDDISRNNMVVKQPQIHIITEGFSPTCEKYFSYDTELSLS
jgi:dienelactone hydrolase